MTKAVAVVRERLALVPNSPTSDDPQEWADFVLSEMKIGAQVGAIIAGGRALAAAKEKLGHGGWDRMFRDQEQSVERPLRMHRSTGFRLMAVAANPVLSNVAHAQHLPTAWYTLYELTKVSEARLEKALERGDVITPDMERKDVKLLMPVKQQKAVEQEEALAGLLRAIEAAENATVERLLALRAVWKSLNEGQVDWLRLVLSKASTKLTELESKHGD